MRITTKTLIYILVGLVYSIIPAVVFGLLLGHSMPPYTVNRVDVLMVFAFTFVPFVIGFLGGEMYVDDMESSDPLCNPPIRKKG